MRSPCGSSVAILGLCALAGLAASAERSQAEPVEIIYGINAQAPGVPKSAVPGGLPGAGDARFTNFNNKIYRTPTTNQWLVVATTNATPATSDQVLLVGSGVTGAVLAQEGVTEFATGQFINFSRLDVPRINDAGQWAMAFRLNGGTTADEKVVRWNGTSFDLVAKGGDAVIPQPGNTFFGSFNSCNIINNGKVGFLGAVAPGSGTIDSAFTDDGAVLTTEVNVSIPAGQGAGESQWADIDSNTFLQSADGAHWIALGEVGLDNAIDKVAVVDGTVVVQKGFPVHGVFTSVVSSITEVWMESSGDWFVRGSNADTIDWVIRNGALLAAEGQPIVPGSAELWESFRAVRGNNRGDWVISGNTNLVDTLTDDVLVFNGKRIVARESDPVDLDNNGMFDDGLYLHLIQDNSTYTDDGYFVFAPRLKSSPTATTGANGSNNASLARVRACRADVNGSGTTTVQDIFDFLAAYFGNLPIADINNSGSVTVQDIFDFLAAYFAGC